jgi:hypothetical protein
MKIPWISQLKIDIDCLQRQINRLKQSLEDARKFSQDKTPSFCKICDDFDKFCPGGIDKSDCGLLDKNPCASCERLPYVKILGFTLDDIVDLRAQYRLRGGKFPATAESIKKAFREIRVYSQRCRDCDYVVIVSNLPTGPGLGRCVYPGDDGIYGTFNLDIIGCTKFKRTSNPRRYKRDNIA